MEILRHRRSRRRAASLFMALIAVVPVAGAQSPAHLLERYRQQARAGDPAFDGFSAERGRAFYFAPRVIIGLGEANCASCHLDDPTQAIRAHRAKVLCRACHVIDESEHPDPANAKKRHLGAFSPAANPERFRDFDRVERHFEVNCRMVLQRACTAVEKGDLITWLIGLR
jgi:hypothetical protein